MSDLPTNGHRDAQEPSERLAEQASEPRSKRASALSASRAKDYTQCPLKFRFSVVDRIPQPPTSATIKGTLVHAVLENLFGVEAALRTPETAEGMIQPQWDELSDRHPDYRPTVDAEAGLDQLIADAHALIRQYFAMERPERIEPDACESFIEVRVADGLLLRGIVDRIDRSPEGLLRVIDYKTGKAPSPRFTEEALFQMRFYALMLREVDRLPTRMQLLYLKSGAILTLDPDPIDIARFEEQVLELWGRISADATEGAFAPKRGPLCGWCSYQSRCPLFGGDPGEPAQEDLARLLSMRQAS